jgi:hypothetical protein
MTGATPSPGTGDAQGEDKVGRMRALAGELSAAGLDARLHATSGILDITATVHRPGGKDICITVDEDGCVALSYWSPPGASPVQVAAVIGRVVAVITGTS